MKMRIQIPVLFSVLLLCSGCASLGKALKAWMGGGDEDPGRPKISTPTFSDQDNLRANSDKQYRRMNRSRFEEEADLKADAGSLWVMEGQGAYLFAQNQTRMVGDLLNVRIEGQPKTQLQTKANVIKKLLDRLESPMRGLASVKPTAPATPAAPAAADAKKPADGAEKPEGAEPVAKNESPFGVQTVPTRIVEQLKDGSYRVRGMHPLMIGKREYKVIVTGIVRSEDFDDAGVDSSKLLDPQFDIVSSRKGASL
jgi:flagellar L-ring protein FlgH